MHAYIAALLLALSATDAQAVFHRIRDVYRAHAPSPFVSYTLKREQLAADGLPDFDWSYTYRVWYRASDASALERRLFNGKLGGLEFARVVFNEACDPGPATADPFNLPPITPQASPPPGSPPVIAAVVATAKPAYDVTLAQREGGRWHLRLRPKRNPDANRLRDVWADASTLELEQVVVSDKLYTIGGPVYDQLDTMTMAPLGGHVVITHIHARANYTDDDVSGDGSDIDYTFSDISFPRSLPDWYFKPATYGGHLSEAPSL